MKLLLRLFISSLILSSLGACHADSPQFPLSQNELIKAVLNDMVFVKGGTFAMGNNFNAQITLTGYYMDKYTTPYYQYRSYQKLINQSYSQDNTVDGTFYPIGVSYHDAASYCEWLGKVTNLPFTLPTEAQWEYAARSRGRNVQYSTDDGTLKPGINIPNYNDFIQNINGYSISLPVKVNTFPPNPLGMYLMNGNSAEWTQDWYGPLSNRSETNPTGPVTGTYKVVRGSDIDDIMASFNSKESADDQAYHKTALSVYNRSWAPANNQYPPLLFRCVINSDKPLPKQ